MITQTELKAKLHYNPNTGIFTHLLTHRTVHKGDIAGCSDKSRGGYVRISIGKGKYRDAQCLAFLYMLGHMPKGEVDHIDHNTQNNKWNNLRDVTHGVNGKNQRKYKNNSSGIAGIRRRDSGKYRARIYVKGKHIDLGTFTCEQDAINARKFAENKYDFHRNHGK